MTKATSLREIKSFDAVCELPRDHYEIGDWCIMTDGIRVWISQQAMGEQRTDHIEVPKAIFDRLLARYERPQKVRNRRKAA